MINLENNYIKTTIDPKGAEINSLVEKSSGTEYIWNANKRYWARHAPILFPIVGRLNNNNFKVFDLNYEMNQHGFARDSMFKVIEKTSTRVLFLLKSNLKTLVNYPFKFKLYVEYSLDENILHVTYKVLNIDKRNISFSIGAHPGFNCPLNENEKFEDYSLEFDKNETTDIMEINTKTALFSGKNIPFLKNKKTIKLSKDLFKSDALVFKNLNSEEIYLKDKDNNTRVTLNFKGFPYLGIWTPKNDAPFICLEPWFGHGDFDNFNGDIKDKDGIINLQINNEFSCNYSIKIN